MNNLRELATLQRGRLVASLLGHLESEVQPSMNPVEWKELREHVLTCVNVYHDFVLDVTRLLGRDEEVIVNEKALQLLDAIYREVRRGG